MRSLTDRVWNSPTFTTWGSFIVGSVKLLVITPIILHKFNMDQVAIWFLFMTILTMSSLADLGFAPTFSRLVSFVYGGIRSFDDVGSRRVQDKREVDWGLMGRVYGNIGTVYVILGAFALLLVATVGTWSLFAPIGRMEQASDVWIAWAVVCALVTSNVVGKRFESSLQGMNYIALVNRWNIVFNVASILASIVVLLAGGEILELVLVLLAFSWMSILRNWYLLTRVVENGIFRSFPFFAYEKDILGHAWGPAWRSALGLIGSTGVVQATGIIYSQFADSALLASYLLTLRVITAVSTFSQAPFYSKLPVLARLRSQGNIETLSSAAQRAMRIALFVFVIGVFIIGVAGNAALVIIGSDVLLLDRRIWVLMSLVWFLERHHAMHAQLYATTNHIPFYVPIIISGAINVGLILALIGPLQIWAFPVAQGISNLLINNWWNVRISLRSVDETFPEFYKNSAFLPTLALAASVLILLLIPVV